MCRNGYSSRRSWLAAWCALALPGAASLAAPGDGLHAGDWTFRPFLSPAIEYDSNLFLRDDREESDTSLSLTYGLDLSLEQEAVALQASAWGLSERFQDFDEQDHDDLGNRLLLSLRTPGDLRLKLDEAYDDVEDVDDQTGRIEDYQLLRGGLSADRYLSESLWAEAGFHYTSESYRDETLYGWDRQMGTLELANDLTDTTAGWVQGSLATLDGEGNDESGDYYRALAGVQSIRTDTLTARLGAGVLGLSAGEEDLTEPAWLVQVAWSNAPHWSVALQSERFIEPASATRNSYDLISSTSGALRYQPVDALTLSLALAYKTYERQNERAGEAERDDLYRGTFRVDYRAPGQFLDYFLETSVSEQEGSTERLSYSRVNTRMGVTLRY